MKFKLFPKLPSKCTGTAAPSEFTAHNFSLLGQSGSIHDPPIAKNDKITRKENGCLDSDKNAEISNEPLWNL